MNLEDMSWKEIVSRIENKFVKEFGKLRTIRGIDTPAGYLIFEGGRLKVERSDTYEFEVSTFQNLFCQNDLGWVIDRVEELFVLGLKNKKEEERSTQEGFNKTKAFLEKGF